MKDLGQMHYFLNIEVWREDGKTLITQHKYRNELIRMFNMSECSPMSSPLEQNVKLHNDGDTKQVHDALYKELVRSLNYLTTTIPNIAY